MRPLSFLPGSKILLDGECGGSDPTPPGTFSGAEARKHSYRARPLPRPTETAEQFCGLFVLDTYALSRTMTLDIAPSSFFSTVTFNVDESASRLFQMNSASA
jgi:hypothetical protein